MTKFYEQESFEAVVGRPLRRVPQPEGAHTMRLRCELVKYETAHSVLSNHRRKHSFPSSTHEFITEGS